MSQPLSDLKVLDLSWVVAGPLIGRALADFGATVVRVESSVRVETTRLMQPFEQGVPGPENSALYSACNAGKLGITLNLGSDEGREVVRDLAAWADIVVESFAPGQMSRWGLDYENLSSLNPQLIMISSSLMGQTGPHSRLAGFGSIGSAASGFGALGGWPDRLPRGPFGPYTDYIAPRFGIIAALAALDNRRRTGRGCYVDISQVETGVWFLAPQLTDYLSNGTVAERAGNADDQMAPHGVYPCQSEADEERFVAVAVRTNPEWERLAELIGRPDLGSDSRFATPTLRRQSAAVLDAALAEWTRTRTARAAAEQLQGVGVPAHISATSRDYCEDPQLGHRRHFATLEHPIHGQTVVEGPRYLLSETPGQVDRAAPLLGQDNAHVACELLGYSPERFAELTACGAFT